MQDSHPDVGAGSYDQVVEFDGIDDSLNVGVPRRKCNRGTLVKLGLFVIATTAIVLLAAYVTRGENSPGGAPSRHLKIHYNDSTPIYLGNGCFWERQYAYINIELKCDFVPKPTRAKCTPFHRSLDKLTAVVGYSGGTNNGPVPCYHPPGWHPGDSSDGSLYETLGHAEAVSVELEVDKEDEQFAVLLTDYFDSFNSKSNGMERPDPMDKGPPYRSLIGIPGGVKGALYPLIEKHNIHKMNLLEGNGNNGDIFNTVWIMDSDKFPFHRAEQYHQYHSNFFGSKYPSTYWNDMWKNAIAQGTIPPTGCPEGHHR